MEVVPGISPDRITYLIYLNSIMVLAWLYVWAFCALQGVAQIGFNGIKGRLKVVSIGILPFFFDAMRSTLAIGIY